MLLGINLALLIGSSASTKPPATPKPLVEALKSVEVTNRDDGPDGFELRFSMGRSGLAEPSDYPLFSNALLKPFSRVVIKMILGATPYILIDGIITHEQFIPSNEPGQSNLIIIGEDISVLMDRDDNPIVHPKQSDPDIIKEIIKKYEIYGFKD